MSVNFDTITGMNTSSHARRPGRPRTEDAPVAVQVMLEAALRAFATYGYDGVSVNALGRQLGVSHNLLHQRFGSKNGLWHAAVDWGFGDIANEVAKAIDPTVTDPLEQLAAILRRFLHASAERPELVGLMNLEGRESTNRLTYLYDNWIEPLLAPISRVLAHLASEGRVRPISTRTMLFLVAHGAAAPFTLRALAHEIDPADPLDPDTRDTYIDQVVDLIIAGLELDPTHPAAG
jgi:AcrR family transcriptional regulator